jgi:transposase InsO family protein
MKSRRELTAKVCGRYRTSDRRGKGVILGEFCKNGEYNRAYAAMLLRGYALRRLDAGATGATRMRAVKVRRMGGGRPRLYGAEVQRVVINVWRRFGYLCGKRLAPVLRRCLPAIRRDRFLHPSQRTCEALRHISAASLDRLLKPARRRLRLKGRCLTRPTTALLGLIPVRTFGDYSSVPPGHVQLDTVSHDGGISSGDYAFSLAFTDVCTGWTERRAVPNRASRWITEAVDQMRAAIPFPVTHLHSDNGSEFINHNLYRYCKTHGIELSRSRAGRKNDNCWVEQKNFDTVRKLVGYARYCSPQAREALNALYRLHGVLQNYVLPSQKLTAKNRVGSRVQKRYDQPLTPAERVLRHKEIADELKAKVCRANGRLDPLALADRSAAAQRRVLALAEDLRLNAIAREEARRGA